MATIFELTVLSSFAAAHRLPEHPCKCRNLHGHTWSVEVTVTGGQIDRSGMVIDFGVLKTHVNEVVEQLDHRLLNEMSWFDGNAPDRLPTAENIARCIFREVSRRVAGTVPGVAVSLVKVWESPTSAVAYREVAE
ncbi:6-carboxytetrahydropterin synthase QueD [Desulforudis sp. 1088]|uniref:6-carboxytetrahydropterin synthase QueD n=1 Tax=unclassified Candidatus Desulforudis TaxID=2635950 RepID=UPI00349AAC46